MKEKTPVAVYDADQKELMGVFESSVMAAKFIYGYGRTKSDLISWITRKIKVPAKSNQLGCAIAIRFASASQSEELQGREYVLRKETYNKFIKASATQR
jgi:hypothetical protein